MAQALLGGRGGSELPLYGSRNLAEITHPDRGGFLSGTLVIRGGRVVFPDGVVQADVATGGGRIAAIGAPGSIGGADRVIEADGLHVFPGIIDPHVHLQTFQDPFDVNVETETRNAAIGGVTTMIPTLLNREDASVSFLDYFPWARRAVEERSLIDAVFGILAVDDAQFLDGLRTVREIGRPAMAMVHAENMSIIHNLKARYIEAGRDDLQAWTDARPDLAEKKTTHQT